MKILTGFNTTSNIYNYATVCDLSEFTIWNEQFKSGYNFTAQNVSVNIVPPESFLSFYGMNVPIDNSTIQLDLLKNGNVGYYEIMRQKIGLTTVGNNTFDYLVFDSDNLITYWLRFNRTGTNLEISKIVFGSSPVSLANYTMSTNIENIAIEYSPIMDNMNNVPYFTTTIKVNNATVKTDSTYQFDGKNIKNVELFSESVGSSMFLTNFGLFKISNPTPTFVQFQNGLRTTIDDVTVVTPPPEQTIDGEGFSVVADYNNTFYGVCTYTKLGTYTQRHFLSPTNSLVYTNYKDIQVVITNATTVADTSDKLSSNDIGNWFKDLGITDGVTALIVGMLISIVFAGICMVLAYKLMGADGMLLVVVGIITLVVGLIVTWAIGLTPVWVIIMLVIICAGLVAVAFRYAVSGA
jgi:hypothetical protein